MQIENSPAQSISTKTTTKKRFFSFFIVFFCEQLYNNKKFLNFIFLQIYLILSVNSFQLERNFLIKKLKLVKKKRKEMFLLNKKEKISVKGSYFELFRGAIIHKRKEIFSNLG